MRIPVWQEMIKEKKGETISVEVMTEFSRTDERQESLKKYDES